MTHSRKDTLNFTGMVFDSHLRLENGNVLLELRVAFRRVFNKDPGPRFNNHHFEENNSWVRSSSCVSVLGPARLHTALPGPDCQFRAEAHVRKRTSPASSGYVISQGRHCDQNNPLKRG